MAARSSGVTAFVAMTRCHVSHEKACQKVGDIEGKALFLRLLGVGVYRWFCCLISLLFSLCASNLSERS